MDNTNLPNDNTFDTDLSDLNIKFDTHSSLSADIIGGTVATVGDFAASVYNSLTPERMNIDTNDLLSRISDNALRVYQENPETIHTLSFIGGVLAPSLGSLKMLNWMRSGMKGANWFSEVGKAESLANMSTLYSEGVQATAEYKSARNLYYARSAANVLADNVAMEVALVGTMNAHPFMDDYNKDFVTNFVSGVAWSPFAAIFHGIGHVAARFEVAGQEIGIAQKATSTLLKDIQESKQIDNLSNQISSRASNVKTWEDILKSAQEITATGPVRQLDGFTKEMAESFILSEKAAMWTTFDKMVSPEIRNMSKEYQSNLLQKIVDDPARFVGIDTIEFIKPTDASIIAQAKGKLFETPKDITGGNIPLTVNTKKGVQGIKIAYSPEDDAFYNLKDERSFARAVDLGYTEDNITKGIDRTYGTFPRVDYSIESVGKGTASIDAEYLKAIAYFDKMDDASFSKLSFAVSPEDIPTLQGIYLRANKLADTNPELAQKFKVAITKSIPNWDNIQNAAATRQGVSKEYLKTLKDVEINFNKFNASGALSEDANGIIRRWIGGSYGIAEMRNLVNEHFRGFGKQSDVINEIYNSIQSKSLRVTLAAQADKDGYVYLYRGLHTKAFGHNSVDSYTTNPVKAQEHAGGSKNIHLYKVKPDEILVGFRDLAGDDKKNNYEILVMSPTRETGTVLDSKGSMNDIITNNSSTKSVYQNISELSSILSSAKGEELSSLLAQGVPLSTISLRINIPLETVEQISTHPFKNEIVSHLDNSIHMYNSASEIGNYLSPEKRTIAISTNMNKVPHAQIKSNLTLQAGKDIQTAVIEDFFRASNSKIVGRTAELLTSEIQKAWTTRIQQGISNIVSEAIGMKLLSSTDFALRKLGDLGTVISQKGKNFAQVTNNIAEELLTPLSTRMTALSKDSAALFEFNTAMAVEASIKGYKEFNIETGKWMKQSEMKPWNDIIDAKTGKKTGKVRNLEEVEYKGQPYTVVTPSVIDTIKHMSEIGREFYELNSSMRGIRGLPSMTDIGFWRPAMNPKDKHIAYVFNRNTLETTLLFGKDDKDLATTIKLFKDGNPEGFNEKSLEVIDKSQQKRYNEIQGRHDPIFMNAANENMLRTGSTSPANVSSNADIFTELMNGYDHYVGYGTRRLFMDYHSDIFQHLEKLSDLAGHGISDQPLSKVGKLLYNSSDAGSTIRNTLLGAADLKEYQGWSSLQDSMQAITESGLRTLVDTITPVLSTFKSTIPFLNKKNKDEDYIHLVHDMKERGIISPWSDVADSVARDRYNVDSVSKIPNMTPRLIALGNSLASTSLLRVMELAQATTNLISLPVLMNSAIVRKYDTMFMNGKIVDDPSFLGIKTMYNGIRRMNDPTMGKYTKYAEDNGIFKPIVSEVNDILHKLYSFNPDKIKQIENLFNDKNGKGEKTIIGLLSTPSDYSESFVRKWAFHTGIEMASTRYNNLSDVSKITFARNFVDEVVGNYTAAQRPVIFQGNLGVAMGLFQTYIVTYGQSLFRHLENKDYKALSKMMLIQGGIFGAKSLPGFSQVSDYIGDHFSDNNYDLESGTYRATNDKLADLILYGLPSNLAPTFTTRGDIAPRIPNIAGGLQNLPSLNLLSSAYQASNRILQAAVHTDDNTFQAIGEALSLQSLSRPIARLSELATGHSITSKGNEVVGPDEVRSFQGIAARVFATRPVSEMKARQALHLDSMYGSIDRDNRQKLIERLKTHIRNGDLNGETVDNLAEEYMRTGSPTGWRSAVNTALGQANTTGNEAIRNYLNPRSPTMEMIDDMD